MKKTTNILAMIMLSLIAFSFNLPEVQAKSTHSHYRATKKRHVVRKHRRHHRRVHRRHVRRTRHVVNIRTHDYGRAYHHHDHETYVSLGIAPYFFYGYSHPEPSSCGHDAHGCGDVLSYTCDKHHHY